MTGATSDTQFAPGIRIGRGSLPVILVAAAGAAALLMVALGPKSVAALAAMVGAAAILARPELGLYALLLVLALPVPIHAGPMILYPHDAVAVLTIVSALALAMRRKNLQLPGACFMVPAACLLLSQVVSLINARNLTIAGAEVLQQAYLLIAAPIGYYLLLCEKRILRKTAKLFMVLMTAEAVLICAQFLLAKAGSRWLIDVFAFQRHTFSGSHRVFGTAGPTVGLLLVASSFLWLSRNLNWQRKLPIIALHVFALFATGTRSAMIIFVFALIFYALFTRKKALGLQVMIPVLAGLMIFAGVVGMSRFSERFVHGTDLRYRLPIDTKALKAVPRHPMIGYGPKAASTLGISVFGAKKVGVENEFVARLYNNGALGLAALVAFGCVPVLGSVSRLKRKHPAAPLGATLAAVIVGIYSGGVAGCLFEGSLGQWIIIFYVMMLAATQITRSDHQPIEQPGHGQNPGANY